MNIPVVNNAASVYDYMGQPNLNSMFINPVNEAEVIRIIKLCKPKDSMDYDGISMWLSFEDCSSGSKTARSHFQSFILHGHIPE